MKDEDWLVCVAIIRATWPSSQVPDSTSAAWFRQWASYPAVTADDVADAIADLGPTLDFTPTLAQLTRATEGVHERRKRPKAYTPELPKPARDPAADAARADLMRRCLFAGDDDPVRSEFRAWWSSVYDPDHHRVGVFNGDNLVDSLLYTARQHPEWVGRRVAGPMAEDLATAMRPSAEEAG